MTGGVTPLSLARFEEAALHPPKALRHRPRRVALAMLLLALPALGSACADGRLAVAPVTTIAYAQRPERHAPALIVLLPGKKSRAGDFERERFIDMARERQVDADLIAADLHFGYYLDGTWSRRLWEDVVSPALAQGYERIWIVGISLGGSGAIGFARDHPGSITGLVLLSPWLGPPEAGEGIRAAGGLAAWTPAPRADGLFESFVTANWEFLKQASAATAGAPAIVLGYGLDEPMEPSFDLLAASLPADRVMRAPGGHRWKTWRRLWAEILTRRVFDQPPRAGL